MRVAADPEASGRAPLRCRAVSAIAHARPPIEPVRLRGTEVALGRHRFAIDHRGLVMGILNRTPDSFFDAGRYWAMDESLARVEEMVGEGADIIDIGGVKAGPGDFVDAAEELHRVIPAVEAVAARFDIPISIDTWRAEVAAAAIDAGASLINDISGLMDPEMVPLAARTAAAVVVCHIQGWPRVANPDPQYADVRGEVDAFIRERVGHCRGAGIPDDRIVVDHGLDLGKSEEQSLELLAHTRDLADIGVPVLLSASNKRFLGALIDRPVDERNPASLATAALALCQGARILRVHDVVGTVRVREVLAAVLHAWAERAPAGA